MPPVTDRGLPSLDLALATYSGVLESLHVGICVWRLEQDDIPASLRLVIANTSACRFLSVESDRVLGQLIHDGFPGSELTPLPTIFTELAMLGGSRNLGEVPYTDATIKEGMFSIVADAIAPRLVCVQFTNITEQRRAQVQLLKSEKMASLGRLVAGIAHEIKNPLNFINNFAALAIEFIDEHQSRLATSETNPENSDQVLRDVGDNLARIYEHGKRADKIINAMLMHVRDRRGDSTLSDYNMLVLECVDLAYHGFCAADRSFSSKIERTLDPAVGQVMIPRQEFARVIVNLVSNACYAMRERQRGGETGYGPALRISTRRSGRDVELTVADNGTGIPPEVRSRLFDPFFTTKPPGEGTGLGLSLSYEIIVKELGGSIEIDEQTQEGASFSVRVPFDAIQVTSETPSN